MTARATTVEAGNLTDLALEPRPPGRPRDERATQAILEAAIKQLEEVGFGRLSVDSVAAEAGVSKATLYRRFKDKADLVTAAVAHRATPPGELPSTDPRADVVRYLAAFEERFGEDCLEVVGGLVGLREEPHAMALHRARTIEPRVGYLRSLLEQARREGSLAPDTDIELVLELLVGGVLARRVMGVACDPRWAERAVSAVWPASTRRPRSA
jgi:AcrR family transcriptional regulator